MFLLQVVTASCLITTSTTATTLPQSVTLFVVTFPFLIVSAEHRSDKTGRITM